MMFVVGDGLVGKWHGNEQRMSE